MLDKERIIKMQITAMNGKAIVSADKEQFSFPRLFVDDIPVNNVVMIKGRDFPELEIDSAVYVITFMKNGDRIRYVGKIKMSLENQLNVQIRDDFGTLMEERRRYFKVQSDIKCVISGFSRGDDVYEFEAPVITVIKNLSIGGIFVLSVDQEFIKDDVILVNFKVDSDFISVMAKILRLQYNEQGKLEGYGCQFINTDQRHEGIFAQFVNKIQLQQRQAQMEKDYKYAEGLKRVKGGS